MFYCNDLSYILISKKQIGGILLVTFLVWPMKLFSSVQFSGSVVSDSLRPHELQHTRPPCPSPTPGVHSNSCPSSRWCHPAISSSVVPFLGRLIYGFLKRKLRSKVIDDRHWAERVGSQRNILRPKKEAACVCVSFRDSNKEIWSNFDFSEWEPKTAKVVKTLQGYVGGAKEHVS